MRNSAVTRCCDTHHTDRPLEFHISNDKYCKYVLVHIYYIHDIRSKSKFSQEVNSFMCLPCYTVVVRTRYKRNRNNFSLHFDLKNSIIYKN